MKEFFGKYFRLIFFLFFPLSWVYIISMLIIKRPTIESMGELLFLIIFLIIWLLITIATTSHFIQNYKQGSEVNYEGWADAFYLITFGVLVYYLLEFVSAKIGIDINIIKHLLNNSNYGDVNF